MDKETWVRDRAYYLWQQSGCPENHDIDFWLAAENAYDNEHICFAGSDHCQFQQLKPLTGGRHVSICQIAGAVECGYRAGFQKHLKLCEVD